MVDWLKGQAGAATSWVGSLAIRDTVEFMRLFHADGAGYLLDLPVRLRFRQPVEAVEAEAPIVRFTVGDLAFEGRLEDERMVGVVRQGETLGQFALQSSPALVPGEYRPVIGHYRLPDREIMLSQDDRGDLKLYYYLDGDRVVRLHSLGLGRFLSEQCETITVQKDQGQAAVTRQAYGGQPVVAPRSDWYREEAVRVPVGEHVIAGTLILPAGDGPHPAVMFCHLADTPERDYYRLFALPFVQRGIAALVYDKRGSGESTGEGLWSEVPELAVDAEAVFRHLQKHPAIRPDRVGLWGISNGAWVAPLVASRVGDAACVIGAAVAGVTPARQEQVRRVNVARTLGASPRSLALIDRFWATIFPFYITGEWTAAVEAVLLAMNTDEELQGLPKHPTHSPGLQPVPPVMTVDEVKAEGGQWVMGGFDCAPVYAGLGCPVLCVWGAEETVIPLDESVQRIEAAMLAVGHPHFERHIIPTANHKLYRVSPAPVGILGEVMHTHLHNVAFAPGVRELMADWAVRFILA